jgi:hypothetical protein
MSKRTEQQWETWDFPYERDFQAYIHKRFKEHKGNIAYVKIVRGNYNGASDELLCVKGKFVAIELKVGDNHPTQQQVEFLKCVNDTGGIGRVAYNWCTVKQVIKEAGYDMDGQT